MADDRETRDRDLLTSLTTMTLKASGAALLGQPVSVSPRTYRIIDAMIEDSRDILRATTGFRGYRHPGVDRIMQVLVRVMPDDDWIEDAKPLKALAEGQDVLDAIFGVTTTAMNTLQAIADSDCPANGLAQSVVSWINGEKEKLTTDVFMSLGVDANVISDWLNNKTSIVMEGARSGLASLRREMTLFPPEIPGLDLPPRQTGSTVGPCSEFVDQIWGPIKHVIDNREAFLQNTVISIVMMLAGPLLRKLQEIINDVISGIDVTVDLVGTLAETIYDLIMLVDIESWALFIAQYHTYKLRAMAFQQITALTSIKRRLRAIERLKGIRGDNTFINRINSQYAILVRSLCTSIRSGERSRDFRIQHAHFNNALVTVNRIIALLGQSRNSEMPPEQLLDLYKEKYGTMELITGLADDYNELRDETIRNYIDHAYRIAKDINYIMNLYMGIKPYETLEKSLGDKLAGRKGKEGDPTISASFVASTINREVTTPQMRLKGTKDSISAEDAVKVDRYVSASTVRNYTIIGLSGGITVSLMVLYWVRSILQRQDEWLAQYYQDTLFQQVRAAMERRGIRCDDIDRFRSEFELVSRRMDYSMLRWELRPLAVEAEAVYKDNNTVKYIGDYTSMMKRLDEI